MLLSRRKHSESCLSVAWQPDNCLSSDLYKLVKISSIFININVMFLKTQCTMCSSQSNTITSILSPLFNLCTDHSNSILRRSIEQLGSCQIREKLLCRLKLSLAELVGYLSTGWQFVVSSIWLYWSPELVPSSQCCALLVHSLEMKRVVTMNVVLVLVPDHSAHISDNEQHCSWCYDRLCGFVR